MDWIQIFVSPIDSTACAVDVGAAVVASRYDLVDVLSVTLTLVSVFVGVAHVPSFLRYVVVDEPSLGPLVIVFVPFHFVRYPDVPLPVTLLEGIDVYDGAAQLPSSRKNFVLCD